MLNESHPLSRYEAKSGKNNEKCLMHFDPDARVFVLSNQHKTQPCDKFSSVICNCLTPFSQWMKMHDFDEEICFPDNCCYENG